MKRARRFRAARKAAKRSRTASFAQRAGRRAKAIGWAKPSEAQAPGKQRRAKTIGIGVALWIALAAAPARATEEGGLLYPAINFLLLLAVLFWFARKPVQTYFADRRAGIRKDLDDAAALKRRAEERYAQWSRRIIDLERELAEIRAGAQQRAEAERASLLADARAAAERIRTDAANAVEHELRRARARLREEASQLAIELASGILREKVTAQDRDRLIDEFIERIGRAPEARK